MRRLVARGQLVVLLPPGAALRPCLSRAALIGAGLAHALFFSVVEVIPRSQGVVCPRVLVIRPRVE